MCDEKHAKNHFRSDNYLVKTNAENEHTGGLENTQVV